MNSMRFFAALCANTIGSIGMKITHLQISGMTCNKCVHHVSEALQAIPGVHQAQVDLAAGSARVEHDDVDTALLLAAVEEEGYEAKVAP